MKTKLAVVLGAGPGLGQALAERWAHEGYAVVLMARNEARLNEAVRDLRNEGYEAHARVVDCASNESIRAALDAVASQLGCIDVLCYNTAVLREGLASQIAPEELCNRYQVDVAGAVCAVQAVLPSMRARGEGTVLLTGGGLALSPVSQFTSLSVHKAALRAYALALNDEVAGDGVFVGIVNIKGNIGSCDTYAPATIARRFWDLAEAHEAAELTY
ncbi:MAG: SDR family NAD(P)-dependent oxidoreductase [Atopobiaceae bacterium]|nr:SDR family NAD(P)-dependent oxidoreductase [Atopobiaceae bacterium]